MFVVFGYYRQHWNEFEYRCHKEQKKGSRYESSQGISVTATEAENNHSMDKRPGWDNPNQKGLIRHRNQESNARLGYLIWPPGIMKNQFIQS